MSHTTEIKSVVVSDVAALGTAVQALQREGVDIQLLRDAKPRMYYENQHGVCDYVVRLGGSRYDIGFQKQADGTYAPVMDLWQGDISKQIGANCPLPHTEEGRAQHAIGRLMQKYAEHAVGNAARKQGFSVERTFTDKEGNVQVVIQAG